MSNIHLLVTLEQDENSYMLTELPRNVFCANCSTNLYHCWAFAMSVHCTANIDMLIKLDSSNIH